MRLQILLHTLFLTIGVAAGTQFMIKAYDPAALEENVIQNTKITYVSGCVNGIKEITGRTDVMLYCMDSSEKVVKSYEEIIRNKIWDSPRGR